MKVQIILTEESSMTIWTYKSIQIEFLQDLFCGHRNRIDEKRRDSDSTHVTQTVLFQIVLSQVLLPKNTKQISKS